MMNKLLFIQKAGRLTCKWVKTGDSKMPLACVWGEAKAQQAASTAFSTDETGRMHLCA